MNNLELKDFQKSGVETLLDMDSSLVYLADVMGLGKTAQAIEFLKAIRDKFGDFPALVVCPASLRLNWKEELNQWAPELNVCVIDSTESFDSLLVSGHLSLDINSFDVLIVGLELLSLREQIQKFISDRGRRWSCLILDEAHKIRTPSTKASKCIYNLINTVEFFKVLFMSGTPLMNSAIDLFKLLQMVSIRNPGKIPDKDADVLSNFIHYSNCFTYQKSDKWGVTYTGVRRPEYLKEIITALDFMLRRTKEDVMLELPDKSYIYQRLPIDVDITGSDMHEELDNALSLLSNGLSCDLALPTLRRAIGLAKVRSEAVKDFIKELFEAQDDKALIIYFYHKDIRDSLLKTLPALVGIKSSEIVIHDGDVSSKRKNENIESFQNGGASILLAQVDSAVGYTATRASCGVFLEYSFLPSAIEQAVDRMHRIGQRWPVSAYFIVSDLELDQILVKALIKKAKTIQKVI